MDLRQSSFPSTAGRSFSGCWTCRLRRKKCDERQPVCEICATLHIACHYGEAKPEWMDGGAKQNEMAEQLKREVKENAHLRRGQRATDFSTNRFLSAPAATGTLPVPNQNLPKCVAYPVCAVSRASHAQIGEKETAAEISNIFPSPRIDTSFLTNNTHESLEDKFGSCDAYILTFYLDHLLPFQFPFYRPSVLEGGKSWILEMLIKSPVIRKTACCQSSYFFSLARGATESDGLWEAVLIQSKEAFEMLREALQVIESAGIAEHLHGAVRILASIMQVQRFEIAILSFDNCQSHLNAALVLFKQLLESIGLVELAGHAASFNAVLSRLGPILPISPQQIAQIPSAEHVAFFFSSALLILDDIVASTVLQEQPKLYHHHHSLLGHVEGTSPIINLESIVGCQNWVLLAIGEIAALDAWKQQCKQVENLNVIDLVRRATAIKDSLEMELSRLERGPGPVPKESGFLLDIFTADFDRLSNISAMQSSLVTRVWAHAALIYLFIVVSGWQPASVDMRYHVSRILELLTHQISPPTLLRTMVWPFCVAGCLAELPQEALLRDLVKALQPPSVFGTVHKALEIMENAWSRRNAPDAANRDLATCFKSQGDHLVLLV